LAAKVDSWTIPHTLIISQAFLPLPKKAYNIGNMQHILLDSAL